MKTDVALNLTVEGYVRRRDFIKVIAGSMAVWPLAARAQQPEQVRRIGVLMSDVAEDSEGQARLTAFVQTLQQLGWTDGRNVRIDIRWGGADADRYRRYAAELVTLARDLIFATTTPVVAALQQGDPGPFRSYLRQWSIQSALVSSPTWRSRAAIRPALPCMNTASAGNGSLCLKR